jgi:hypothetical protein
MMKRYLLFCGNNYYPNGGWSDLIGAFDTIEECGPPNHFVDRYGDTVEVDWWHLVDTEVLAIIDQGEISHEEELQARLKAQREEKQRKKLQASSEPDR